MFHRIWNCKMSLEKIVSLHFIWIPYVMIESSRNQKCMATLKLGLCLFTVKQYFILSRTDEPCHCTTCHVGELPYTMCGPRGLPKLNPCSCKIIGIESSTLYGYYPNHIWCGRICIRHCCHLSLCGLRRFRNMDWSGSYHLVKNIILML